MKKFLLTFAAITCSLIMSAQLPETMKFFGDSHLTGTIGGNQVDLITVLDVVTVKDNMKTIIIPEIQNDESNAVIPSFMVTNLNTSPSTDGYACPPTDFSVVAGGKNITGKLQANYNAEQGKLSVTVTMAYGDNSDSLTYVQEGNFSTYVEIGGEAYRTVVLKDGREWMIDNLRYVPEGKTVAALTNDYTGIQTDGIYYPAVFSIKEGAAVLTPSSSRNVIRTQGLLYTSVAAMNGTALPTEDWKDASNTQGLAPAGWHVPTAQEWVDLVGACSQTSKNNTEAPYYVQSLAGASLDTLNKDGFNLLPYPYLNQGKKYLGSYLNKSEGNPFNVYPSMCYFQSSTGRSATQNYAAMITNNSVKTMVNCSYNFLTNACYVRFIKDYSDSTTDINTTTNHTTDVKDNAIYNLSGQRVTTKVKDIVIKNGKKYLMK